MAQNQVFGYKDLECKGTGITTGFDFVWKEEDINNEKVALNICDHFVSSPSNTKNMTMDQCLNEVREELESTLPSTVCNSDQVAMWIPAGGSLPDMYPIPTHGSLYPFFISPQINDPVTKEVFTCVDQKIYNKAMACHGKGTSRSSCAYDDPELCRQQESCNWTGIPQTNLGGCFRK